VRFGALDSAPIRCGGTAAEALAASMERARRLDGLRCHRLWFTEHHLAPDVASASPLLLAGQAGTLTGHMRLGAGGVMIRNHAPLITAEQVTTLSLLHRGRVDIGLGRSGGSEPATDVRIRRTVMGYDSFQDDVRETAETLERLGAEGVQVFVLASSPETAAFAGREGLGLAVAGHIAPAGIDGALAAYRERFRPRAGREHPVVVLCLPILVADSDDDARWWFRSVQRRYLDRLRTGGAPLLPPDAAELDWSASERYRVDAMLDAALVGSEATVRAKLLDVVDRWGPDEVMAMSDLPDPAATLRSYVGLAEVTGALTGLF
jgi:luciferase family oxidoreductase group 1